VNAFIALPLIARVALVFALGILLGAVVNWAIYALAWFSRPISPWQQRHPSAAARRWPDYFPLAGWLSLRREAAIHGSGFWVRPLLIELASGMGLAALYVWEISGNLTPPLPLVAQPSALMLHRIFFSHLLLIALMLAATFIDFDEKTIPDEITIPGALLGLALAVLWPDSHLPIVRVPPPPALAYYGPLLLTSTDFWPAWLNSPRGLWIGIAIFIAWCAALIPALCTLRRGWQKAVQFYFASAARHSNWWKMLLLAVLGSLAIAAVWQRDGQIWQALLTSLVGLAFGGGLIWAVRIVGSIALHKEAMGFGDVTLMAMIGALLGWQACLVIFFLSPFAALFIALTQWILTGRRDIAFGPYLCFAALVVIIKWPAVWDFAGKLFGAGWLLPALLAVCLMLMMGLLMLWRIIEQALFGRR
jgi:leader peptidase (prepilin peptidase) / N-methyltransferase